MSRKSYMTRLFEHGFKIIAGVALFLAIVATSPIWVGAIAWGEDEEEPTDDQDDDQE